ncbi:hypothetical protein MML48_4g00007478 [Holotrichia oblita]|uniref:Uncharacterized protein n=1 Tax=Holotrichia oblita TaxID=644536 RepID=A0ACB9TA04_HOLOL|nr:hypothetical protein MML48_4g00007478 [Holotrichia oblita]
MSNKTRSKTVNRSENKRAKAKALRYSPKALPDFPKCGLQGRPYQPYQCESHLTMRDIKYFHKTFDTNTTKIAQDSFQVSYCKIENPKRKHTPTDSVNNKLKSITIKYTVKGSHGGLVPVCREAFLGILSIEKYRVLRVLKKFKVTGQLPHETRGGNRITNKNDAKNGKMKTFIESLRCTESHYCRSKSTE